MKKQTKAKTVPTDDSSLETRILLEEMNKGIKTIGEQHGTIIKRLDTIDSKLSQHDEELQIIKAVVHANSSELKSVKTAVMEVDTKVSKLDTHAEKLEGRVGRIEDCVTKIDSKLDTVTTNHEQRLQKLEAVR